MDTRDNFGAAELQSAAQRLAVAFRDAKEADDRLTCAMDEMRNAQSAHVSTWARYYAVRRDVLAEMHSCSGAEVPAGGAR